MWMDELMPGVVDDLKRLIGHPSVAFPGFPPEPVHAMADDVLRLFHQAGVTDIHPIDVGGQYSSLFGEIPAPPGRPTVLLYAHYDVQPAPLDQGWTTDPWTATVGEDGRIYGRGAADDKSGIVAHLGTLRAFGGSPPVGVKVLIEGEEETDSHIQDYIRANPERFACDAFVITDGGNLRVAEPVMTTTLRGNVVFTVTVSTLAGAVHSGLFGGAAPDALLAMIQMLSTLHTPEGDLAVAGLHVHDWMGTEFPEEDFHSTAGILDGVSLTGTGRIAERIWARPALTVIGLDAPATAGAVGALIPSAKAKLSLRIPPGADPKREFELLRAHLEANVPVNARLEFGPPSLSAPFEVETSNPVVLAAKSAMSEAYGIPVMEIGCGGSIPLCEALMAACPTAATILWGAEDFTRAHIHGPQESVDPQEIGRIIAAQVFFLQRLGAFESYR